MPHAASGGSDARRLLPHGVCWLTAHPIAESSGRADGDHREAGLSYSELIDGRGSTPALSSADVRAIVDALSRVARESRLGPTAILVDTDLAHGILRMLEILVEDVRAVRPFRHQEEAEKWLADVGEGV